ncbi:hypothetical protein JCM6882_006191 [Rhodosporidiobolus microsporus]
MSRPTDFLTFTSYPSPHSSSSSASASSSSSSRSPLPPPRTSLLLTDTLAAPGAFAVAHFLQRALRPAAISGAAGGGAGAGKGKGKAREGRRRVVLVGVAEREEYWAALMRKNGIQLPTETVAGHFSYLDATSPSVPLSSLYASLCALLRRPTPAPPAPPAEDAEDEAEGPIVIVDDLSALVWRGEGAREVGRWWIAVRGAVDATNSSLITLLHADSLSPSYPPAPSSTGACSTPFEDSEDQYLFRTVLQRSDVWVEVAGLMTGGGTGGTRGEITIHRGPSLLESTTTFTIDPSPPLQYRLEDNGAQYEVKGLGRFL